MVLNTRNFSTADCSQFSKVFEKSLKIGIKNLRRFLDIVGIGDYEPWS